MSISATPTPPYPLDESFVEKLDPEYVAFYNQYIINQQQVHFQPVSASRTSGVLIPGASQQLEVGSIKDYQIERFATAGPAVPVRVFTPTTPAPEAGYPVLVYFHGGGWVLGNINTENVVCSRFCQLSNCVVISVDYRLAPEDVWPAAVHDSWEAMIWVKRVAVKELHLDVTKVAVGGSSAGGNLAAIMTNKSLQEPGQIPKIGFQVLVVPVTDNTASVSSNATYKSNEKTAALPAEKMMWYREKYLPNPADWNNPEASPLFYPESNFAHLPPAFIATAELDVLRAEGQAYADKLAAAGVPVTYKVYKGMPHPFMAMDGVLTQGAKLVNEMTLALKEAFQAM